MNEEEKKAIERIDYIQDFIIENGQYNADVNDMQYFSKVLNIIKKQSKEIEELKEDRKKYAEEYIHNNPWLYKQLNENYILRVETDGLCSKKWEEKIKAKIEEYKKQIEKMEKDDNGIGFTLGKEWSDLKAKVEFGQSLLEKE